MSSFYSSLNVEVIKTPFSPCSNSSSSSTTNSPRSILTRKPRTPRKRPNQTYNEAAAILSTVYPKIFPLQKNPLKFTKSLDNRSPPFLSHPDLDHAYLLPVLQVTKTESRGLKACEAESRVYNYSEDDDFSAESLLDDQEIENGIDSIFMNQNKNDAVYSNCGEMQHNTCCNLELRAMRHVDEGDWWRSPCVDVAQITQPNAAAGLRLKLDYDAVLKAWSGKASPFAGDHVQVRLAQTDLFPGEGAEKRCARLFCKKPRYQITKLNQRPEGKICENGQSH